MSKSSSLRRSVLGAFLLFALVSGLFFALVGTVAIKTIEERLVEDRLKSIAQWASIRRMANLEIDMPDGTVFYDDDAIPLPLRGLEPGIHEPIVDGIVLNALAGEDSEGKYVVVDYASDYDRLERMVFLMFAAGFIGFMVLSFVVGHHLYRRIVSPISALAESVRGTGNDTDRSLLPHSDEIGLLANAFRSRTEELKQFLARERFFTGDVSHELRTPLTVITGAAEILIARTMDRPDLHAPAERILRAAMEASDSVSALLVLARTPELTEGPGTLIAPVIRAEMERCQALLRDKPVSLQLEVDTDFTVRVRSELLAIAVGNLIRNACQYTEKGSVLVRLIRDGVIVEDTGPGVPDNVCAKVRDGTFDPPAGSTGSGLGLGLVMRICERLGAVLRVKSDSTGAVFTVVFPPALTKT